MKKKIIIVLASTMLVSSIAPVMAVNVQASEPVYVNDQNLEAKITEDAQKLAELKDAVKGTQYENMTNSAIAALEKLKAQNETDPTLKFNPETIYDLDSLGARIEALADVIDAINFAANELSGKVEAAHREMGFAITKLVIRIADPFSSVESIKNQVAVVNDLKEKLVTYADLDPNSRATVYAKAKLRKAIWNTRFERDQKILGVKNFKTYNNLNKVITKAVGIQLRRTTTVQDVDNAVLMLQDAMEFALQQ